MSDDVAFDAFSHYEEVKGAYKELIAPLLSENPPQKMRDLANALYVELINKVLLGRPHGSRYTLGAGCQGPLCRKAERDHQRKKYARAQQAKGLTVRRYERLHDYDEILEIVQDAHINRLHKDKTAAEWLVMARKELTNA